MLPKAVETLINRIEPLYGNVVQFTRGSWSGLQATVRGVTRLPGYSGDVDSYYLDLDNGDKINILWLDDLGIRLAGAPKIPDTSAYTLFYAENLQYNEDQHLGSTIAKLAEKGLWARYTPIVPVELMDGRMRAICYSGGKKRSDTCVLVEDLPLATKSKAAKMCEEILPKNWDNLSPEGQRALMAQAFSLLGKDLNKKSKAIIWHSSERAFSPFTEFTIRLGREQGIPVINFAKSNWQESFKSIFPGVQVF